MKINKSPWIHQLDQDREPTVLGSDIDTDVSIVGAGIAGISTAFFILKYTNERVVVLDQGKLAHGATGHNAGQVVARFERPLSDIEKEFGFDLTKNAIQDLYSTWSLIDEMYSDAGLDIVFSRTRGNIGLTSLYQVVQGLKDLQIEILSGLPKNDFFISETAPFRDSIPKVFDGIYTFVPHKYILERMETEDTQFQALYSDQAACMNSALFCQEIVLYLLKKFPTRFNVFENTHIKKLVLKDNHALLDAHKYTINTSRVILCTNGFENIDILNDGGLEIDKKFHHLVDGVVGYMSGYLENNKLSPTAIAYYDEGYDALNPSRSYLYLTRRPHGIGDKNHNLICMGGPEVAIEDRVEYQRDYDYPDEIPALIDQATKKEYDPDPNHKITYEFTWHGIMGYTPNRIRLIGKEPKNPVLLYNLGCNGIGIIPSVYGGRRIARIIARENLTPSIFDPKG